MKKLSFKSFTMSLFIVSSTLSVTGCSKDLLTVTDRVKQMQQQFEKNLQDHANMLIDNYSKSNLLINEKQKKNDKLAKSKSESKSISEKSYKEVEIYKKEELVKYEAVKKEEPAKPEVINKKERLYSDKFIKEAEKKFDVSNVSGSWLFHGFGYKISLDIKNQDNKFFTHANINGQPCDITGDYNLGSDKEIIVKGLYLDENIILKRNYCV